jgi:saccharopine dehydrogenase (NAD+, L-lysine-forming)
MLDACLQSGTPYVDIAGEVEHLRVVAGLDGAARQAGVPLLTGAGFGATYGDCLARHVVDRLPDATHLQISVAADNAIASPAARRTTLAVIAGGGAAIDHGAWVRRPFAHATWTVAHQGRVLPFAAAPMGELIAASASTGVANIVVGRPMPHRTANGLRLLTPMLRAALALAPLRRAIERRSVTGPVEESPSGDRISRVWAEARNARGHRVAAYLECGEGYAATAAAIVTHVEVLLSRPLAGAFTPARAFGADHVLKIPGVKRIDLPT